MAQSGGTKRKVRKRTKFIKSVNIHRKKSKVRTKAHMKKSKARTRVHRKKMKGGADGELSDKDKSLLEEFFSKIVQLKNDNKAGVDTKNLINALKSEFSKQAAPAGQHEAPSGEEGGTCPIGIIPTLINKINANKEKYDNNSPGIMETIINETFAAVKNEGQDGAEIRGGGGKMRGGVIGIDDVHMASCLATAIVAIVSGVSSAYARGLEHEKHKRLMEDAEQWDIHTLGTFNI